MKVHEGWLPLTPQGWTLECRTSTHYENSISGCVEGRTGLLSSDHSVQQLNLSSIVRIPQLTNAFLFPAIVTLGSSWQLVRFRSGTWWLEDRPHVTALSKRSIGLRGCVIQRHEILDAIAIARGSLAR